MNTIFQMRHAACGMRSSRSGTVPRFAIRVHPRPSADDKSIQLAGGALRRLTKARGTRPSTVSPSHLQPSALSFQPSSRAGFTLIEMLIVILIIAILVAVSLGVYQQARTTAWKERARDSARQIATAWNVYLMDNHAFPVATSFQGVTGGNTEPTFQTLATNMVPLHSAKVYLEQSADQSINGMKDKWGNPFCVRLDLNYDGKINSPYDNSTPINANVVVWSWGPNPSAWSASASVASRSNSWVVIWQ